MGADMRQGSLLDPHRLGHTDLHLAGPDSRAGPSWTLGCWIGDFLRRSLLLLLLLLLLGVQLLLLVSEWADTVKPKVMGEVVSQARQPFIFLPFFRNVFIMFGKRSKLIDCKICKRK